MKKNNASIIMSALNEQNVIVNSVNETLRVARDVFFEFELILINDGSTDDTEKLMIKLQKKNKEIQFYNYKKNFGVGHAFKKGLEVSKYEYVMFLNSDSSFDMESIKKLWSSINDEDCIIGYRSNRNKRKFIRRTQSYLLKSFLNYLFKASFEDYTGHLVFKKKIIQNFIIDNSSSWSWDILREININNKNLKIADYPIVLKLPESESKVASIKNIIKNIIFLIRYTKKNIFNDN